jgi:arylformamidase
MAAGGMKSVAVALLLAFALAAPARAAGQTVERSYGDHPAQRLDFTPAEARDAPLVLFVHGGGWSRGDKGMAGHMAAYFHGEGYAFAAANYRLVPETDVAGQGADVAAALADLLRDADRLGIDSRRILLIGHSAGAHLAALVGTDPAYLAAQRIPVGAIDGIVLLDGAGYDVPRQIAAAGPFLRRVYLAAFGNDAAAQRRLSPLQHAASPNAAEFLILHVARRPDSAAQSAALGEALRAAGTSAEVEAVDTSHAGIFRQFGRPGHRATALSSAFARRIFAAPR